MLLRARNPTLLRQFSTSAVRRQVIPKAYKQSFPTRYDTARKKIELNNLSQIFTELIKVSIRICCIHGGNFNADSCLDHRSHSSFSIYEIMSYPS